MVDMKLFGKWDFDVNVPDRGMARYISLEPIYYPNTAGRQHSKLFAKSKMNIVERLLNRLMRSGQGTKKLKGRYIRGVGNTGNKQNAYKTIISAFEIIEKRTKKNPMQVLVDAIVNSGPSEETTTIIYGGIKHHQAIDVSPQRRVDFGLKYISLGALANSFSVKKSLEEALADEIMLAANNDNKSFAISRKEEVERIAKSAR